MNNDSLSFHDNSSLNEDLSDIMSQMSSLGIEVSIGEPSPSSPLRRCKAAQVHNYNKVYVMRAKLINNRNEAPIGAIFRFTLDLFSEKAQSAMKPSSIMPSTWFLDSIDLKEQFGADMAIDFCKVSPKESKSGAVKCKVANMTTLEFIRIAHCTPTAHLDSVEKSLLGTAAEVTLVAGHESAFNKSTVTNKTLGFAFYPSEKVDPNFFKRPTKLDEQDALCAAIVNKRSVDARIGNFEKELSALLGATPILPEEKVFTGLRALAYRQSTLPKTKKPIDAQRLVAFYQLVDAIEFRVRQYTALVAPTEAHSKELYRFVTDTIEQFPYQAGFFQKMFTVLNAMNDVIRVLDEIDNDVKGLVSKDAMVANYLPDVKAFFVKILTVSLKDQLKCSVPVGGVRAIAKENLVLRSSLLLSQFRFEVQRQYPQVVADLEKVVADFRNDDWVEANAHLCQVMLSDFMQRILLGVPRNFGDQQEFAPYKLGAAVVNLMDFFSDVVGSSSTYRWINFGAVKELEQYLTQAEKEMEKGRLAPLQVWVTQLKEAGNEDLPKAFKSLFGALRGFQGVKEKFEKENKAGLLLWLEKVQKQQVDSKAYQDLCVNIDKSYNEINQALEEISLQVNLTQALIVMSAQENVRDMLLSQLDILNKKIHDTCHPFVHFLHNFRALMRKDEALQNVYAISLFETDRNKLFMTQPTPETLEEALEVRIDDDSDDEIETQPVDTEAPKVSSPNMLTRELDEVFSNKKRRKIFAKLNEFFTAHNRKVRIETGKGSHLKVYIGAVPIIIPASNELKVGTAGSIRDDILNQLRTLV